MEYIGKLISGDFEDNTMMFEIEGKMTLQAGTYKIVQIEVGNKKKRYCTKCKSGLINYPEIGRRTCKCGALGYNVED